LQEPPDPIILHRYPVCKSPVTFFQEGVSDQQAIYFVRRLTYIILDEAASSVDTRTEKLIQEGMTRLREGRTSFVTAHRLSTIRDADLIAVIEDGRIEERGTHQSLLYENGIYARFHRSRFETSLK